MNSILLFLKGFLLGIANIVPGVSGAVLAISLGIYEKLIKAVTHFFTDFKENLKLLFPIVIGVGIAVVFLSKVINFYLNTYTFATILFFIGLILGGVPTLFNKLRQEINLKNILVFLLVFTLILIFPLLKIQIPPTSFKNMSILGYILLFLVGILWAGTMVIPGVSGTFTLMLIGYYKPIIELFSSVTNFSMLSKNIVLLLTLGSGLLLGVYLFSKLVEILFKKNETRMYYAITAFLFSSIATILLETNFGIVGLYQVIIGILLFIIGLIVSVKLAE